MSGMKVLTVKLMGSLAMGVKVTVGEGKRIGEALRERKGVGGWCWQKSLGPWKLQG